MKEPESRLELEPQIVYDAIFEAVRRHVHHEWPSFQTIADAIGEAVTDSFPGRPETLNAIREGVREAVAEHLRAGGRL